MDNISEHITYTEATHSNTAYKYGIKNEPNDLELKNMKMVAEKVFEPVRKYFNKPIKVNSFFRSVELNAKISGSSSTSDHTRGMAIDMDGTEGLTNKEIFNYIKNNLTFKQLIWEFGKGDEPDWVHVSYDEFNNKRQILRSIINGGVTKYIPFE